MAKFKIGIKCMWLNDGSYANFIGDAQVVEGWVKYLRRRDDVEYVIANGNKNNPKIWNDKPFHAVIHFHPWLPLEIGCLNILYAQNAWPPHAWPGGTVGEFHRCKSRFDGYIFVSEGLREHCEADGPVIPFGSDPEEMYYEYDEKYAHPVCFVGNDIRGRETNERYLLPAISQGLVIYGGPWPAPYAACHRGKIAQEELHKVYSSAKINLNFHHGEHALHGTPNQRLYDILACGGNVLSDYHDGMLPFAGPVLFTDGDEELKNSIRDLVGCECSDEIRKSRRDFILAHHTYAHRVAVLVDYLKGIM